MNRAQGRDYLRRLPMPRRAVRLALLIAGGLALAAPALATGGPATAGPSISLAGSSSARAAAPQLPAVGTLIYNQYDNATPTFPYDITSQEFETNLATSTAEAADDFIVPTNATWTIDGVAVDGEYRSSDSQNPAPVGFHVRFWSDNAQPPPTGHLPGNMMAERLSQTYTNGASPGDVTISVNPPVQLPAGTYWVSVQARLDFGTNTQTRQWYWHNRAVTSNSGAAWRNPGNYWMSNCVQFSRRATCQNSTHAPDQVFSLYGSSSVVGPPPPPPPPPPPAPTRCHVPNVTGQTLIRARPIIANAHCRVGQLSYIQVSRRRRGRVIGQNPHAGRNLPRNSRVNLLVGR